MKCKHCPERRRFARGSVECPYYGIIIREDHEGGSPGVLMERAEPDIVLPGPPQFHGLGNDIDDIDLIFDIFNR